MSLSRDQTNASSHLANPQLLFIFCATRAGIYLFIVGWDVRDAGWVLSFLISGRRDTANRPFDRAKKIQSTGTRIVALSASRQKLFRFLSTPREAHPSRPNIQRGKMVRNGRSTPRLVGSTPRNQLPDFFLTPLSISLRHRLLLARGWKTLGSRRKLGEFVDGERNFDQLRSGKQNRFWKLERETSRMHYGSPP